MRCSHLGHYQPGHHIQAISETLIRADGSSCFLFCRHPANQPTSHCLAMYVNNRLLAYGHTWVFIVPL